MKSLLKPSDLNSFYGEQLDVAKRYLDAQMERFRFDKPNVEFRLGYIEDLKLAGIEDESVDVVISNCVISLSPDKKSVYSEIFVKNCR
ncbi:hypothetical protein BH23BAC3_BH23BAC3_32270 [soil metagenome]